MLLVWRIYLFKQYFLLNISKKNKVYYSSANLSSFPDCPDWNQHIQYIYNESLLAPELPIKLSTIEAPVKIEQPGYDVICSINEPGPAVEPVLSLDFIECRSVDISRQLFKASWQELKTVLRCSEAIAIASTKHCQSVPCGAEHIPETSSGGSRDHCDNWTLGFRGVLGKLERVRLQC